MSETLVVTLTLMTVMSFLAILVGGMMDGKTTFI